MKKIGLLLACAVALATWLLMTSRSGSDSFTEAQNDNLNPQLLSKSQAPESSNIAEAVGNSKHPHGVAVSPHADPAQPSREMDSAFNPYAAGLRKPGTFKRTWDADFINQFESAKIGDPVQFELTQGTMAQGTLKIIQQAEGRISYVSGILTAPEKGTFFFLRPPEGSKAGKAVGVIEFPESRIAYRVEPTQSNGDPELWQRQLNEVVCESMIKVDESRLQAMETNETSEISPLNPDLVASYVPDYNTNINGTAIISLQSLPGAKAVILLDFFGGYTPHWGGVNYTPAPSSNAQIRDIWKRVAEDYLPFNINVTTDIRVYLAAPPASRQRCCYTTTPVTEAGVAYMGSWNWGNDAVCWSVYYVGKAAAEVGAHEVGHTLGLGHQGQNVPNGSGGTTEVGYYGGHGSGATGWAPIMGVGYYQPVTTWAKGEYIYANNTGDALRTITNANNDVAYRTDDTGNSLGGSRFFEAYSNNTLFAEGVIERTGDTDAFQFTTSGGTVSLTAKPVGDWGNVALSAVLVDSSGTVISSNSPESSVSASILSTIGAGTYTLQVTGAGRKSPYTNGFSSYGSLGYYAITGTVAGVRQPTRLTVAEHAPNNTVVGTVTANNPNSSPLVYSITSGNLGGTFSIDNNGVVRVVNNTLLDYNRLATNVLYAVQFELLVNIANVNNAGYTELGRRVVVTLQKLYAPVPTLLAASPLPGLRVSLSWFGDGSATSYNIKRSTVPGGPYTTVGSSAGASYVDSGLGGGNTYYYVVSAVNAAGESAHSTEVSISAQVVANFGFETPSVGSGHVYNVSGGLWTFGGSSGNGSGILGNGSAFSNPSAPEGTQAAFLQSYGTLSQNLAGFTPGTTYTIVYSAAQRPGNNQTWNVMIDSAVIQTNAPGGTSYTDYSATFTATKSVHNLTFAGTDLFGGDNTVFIDNVRILAVVAIPNFGFETPRISNYQYNPQGATWTFTGAPPSGSGLIANGSGFSNPNAPEGVQAAFIQQYGTISRTLTGLTPGKSYAVTYYAAQRGGNNQHGGESWNVLIDNSVIQSNSPGSTSYAAYSTAFVATSSSHTLRFVGTDLAGGDNTVFIDNVVVGAQLDPVLPVVTLTSPVSEALYVSPANITVSASVTTNANVINRVEFLANTGALIGVATNAPYTCSWTNPPTGMKHRVYARLIFNEFSYTHSVAANITVVNQDLNLGFEKPVISGHSYGPSGASWFFEGIATDEGSGLVANGSGFNNPNAPQGSQAAFLQSHGIISQTMAGYTPGTTYTITYSAAQRPGNNQTWNVMIDSTVLQTNNTFGNSSYTTFATLFTATSTIHTLKFVGTDLPGGDNTVFIDNLTINPPIGAPTIITDTQPTSAIDVVGSQVMFTASITGGGLKYQWQKITGGVPVNISLGTNSTLTLNNLQLSDAGSYRLQASNAFGIVYTATRALNVNNMPAPVNNVVTSMAAQTGAGSGSFTPTWALPSGSLVHGQLPSSSSGNFSLEVTGRNLQSLTSGGSLTITATPGSNGDTTSTNYVTCGNGGAAGANVVYTLSGSYGYNLTNITIFGGWKDAGRDQQAYTIYYSKKTAPSAFLMLGTVNYNPANPSSVMSATRATLRPASGFLATNVAAVKIEFTSPSSENGYCGYSQIQVFGAAALPAAAMTSLKAALPQPDGWVMNIGDMVPGRNYVIQSTTNLGAANWEVETNFIATSPAAFITNSINGPSQKFYRVMGY